MLATGTRFSFRDVQVTTAMVDLDAVRVSRARTASFQPALEQDQSAVKADFDFPEQEVRAGELTSAAWESSDNIKEEEFSRAISLGLFDYMRKSRSNGFIVSLSGGADSSAVAVLCAMMVQLARRELGEELFAEKLAYIKHLSDVSTESEIVSHLLTTVYQSTRNSSQTTRDAAASLANALGANHVELDVDSLVEDYTSKVAGAIGRELTWEADDLALQNIQARARGPSVWMLANLKGALLLATSNRSEAAVGYATMDGDTCGGLSPIAGIDKAFLRQWLRWMETDGPNSLGPIPQLALVNQQDPTAELRPQEQGQTDESDLMPYDLLDAIERAAIRDKRLPLEVFLFLQSEFPQYSIEPLAVWIDRFFRLWCRNQWKRERYAPSFHVDDENLDPKTWCRFPILSGGFERELRELRTHVDALQKQRKDDEA
jgi:NAD+ synthase (glutamine-hydrolysing)